MISRKTALALALVYDQKFSHFETTGDRYRTNRQYVVDRSEFYDFLFQNDYPAWFCNIARNIAYEKHIVKDMIMKLHTRETVVKATQDWTWDQRQKLGQTLLQDLSRDILNYWHENQVKQRSRRDLSDEISSLTKQLELDGYVYQFPQLLIPEDDVLDVQQETSVLESLYTSLGLDNKDLTFQHLSLSEQHYISGVWSDSIANSRKFLESVLREVASNHSSRCRSIPLPDTVFTKPVAVRDYLETAGLLENKEKRTIAEVYGLLSETGSHPYMAASDQARLLRHLALTFAQFSMIRLQGAFK